MNPNEDHSTEPTDRAESLAEFWEKYTGADVVLWTYKDKDSVKIELEDLYQQFKARMLSEMKAEAQEAQRRHMDIRMKVPRKG